MRKPITTTIHLTGTTYEIEQNFIRLLESNFIIRDKLALVTIKYNTSRNNVEDAPVRLYFTDGTAILLNLTAGYGGTGPRTTCDILTRFDLPQFNVEDILKHQDILNLNYTLIDMEFINPDGSMV